MIDSEHVYEEMFEDLLHIVSTDAGAPRFRDGYRKVGHIATGWFSVSGPGRGGAPGEPRGAVPQTPFLVLELFGAVSFLSALFESVPWLERLEAISDRLRVATLRTRVAQGLSIPDVLNFDPEKGRSLTGLAFTFLRR